MKNLGLIIKREYLSRVTKKSFILTTLLTPLAILLFIVIASLIFSYNTDETSKVALIDKGNIINNINALNNDKSIEFIQTDKSLEDLRSNWESEELDGILLIPEVKNLYTERFTIFYYSLKPPSINMEDKILSHIRGSLRDFKIQQLNIDQKSIDALNTRIDLDPEPIDASAEDQSQHTNKIAMGLGALMGFVMYLVVFLYGMMVMRSVMEEKTNRIVEVMISSVKPIELMLGKIIGVGGVGLTQLLIWAILIPLIQFIAISVLGVDMGAGPTGGVDPAVMAEAQADADFIQVLFREIANIDWWYIIPLFILYFIGGYLLYASLFAAVGSAVGDDIGESQSLTLPISIPVILAFYIMIKAIEVPDSGLAVFSSIFPLFSPIVMPARLAFEPPFWQVLVSVIILALTCVFFAWVAGRIYRVGILMYGKKGSFKELFRWLTKQY